MPNPSLLLLDSDALIQILITNSTVILRKLRIAYKIQPTIVPEVEIEIRSSKRFGRLRGPELQKAVSTGTIAVLDQATYHSLLTADAALQAAAIGTSYNDIQLRGAAYARYVDPGEAYTFSAGVTLSQPVASNDWTAVKAMINSGLQLPKNVLRAYDLFVFASQAGIVPARDCEQIRSTLLQASEFVPAQQKCCSFQDGVKEFRPRLIDGSKHQIGIVSALPTGTIADPLVILPKT